MNGKTTKMLALVAIIGLCAVALIGAGYAAFAGTAKTYNEQNAATVSYMTLTPQAAGQTGAWAPIVNNVESEFSTYVYNNNESKTAYYLPGVSTTVPIVGNTTVNYIYKALGTKDFVLKNMTGENITQVIFESYAGKGVGNATFVYILGISDGTTTTYQLLNTSEAASNTFTFDYTGDNIIANTGVKTYTVSIGIGYVPTGSIDSTHPIGTPAEVATKAEKVVTPSNASTAPEGFSALSFAFNVSVTSVPPQS